MYLASDKKRLLAVQLLAVFFLHQIKNFIVFTEKGRNNIKTVLTPLILATEIISGDCCHNWCFGVEPRGNGHRKERF